MTWKLYNWKGPGIAFAAPYFKNDQFTSYISSLKSSRAQNDKIIPKLQYGKALAKLQAQNPTFLSVNVRVRRIPCFVILPAPSRGCSVVNNITKPGSL
jgi:hypothetical protein